MKLRTVAGPLLLAVLAFSACKKDVSSNPASSGQSAEDSLVVRMQQGISPDDDTVFLFQYDTQQRIQTIIDSTNEDTMRATYDEAGRLSDISRTNGIDHMSYSFTYNNSGLLTYAGYSGGPYFKEHYTLEYTNGVLSKQSRYDDAIGYNSLSDYCTYEIKDGNITTKKSYYKDGTLANTTTYTYTDKPNMLQPVALFDIFGNMGLTDLSSLESMFNKNLAESISSTDINVDKTVYTYTYNKNNHLSKSVSDLQAAQQTRTRFFSYAVKK